VKHGTITEEEIGWIANLVAEALGGLIDPVTGEVYIRIVERLATQAGCPDESTKVRRALSNRLAWEAHDTAVMNGEIRDDGSPVTPAKKGALRRGGGRPKGSINKSEQNAHREELGLRPVK
jgi:hypothetical protein